MLYSSPCRVRVFLICVYIYIYMFIGIFLCMCSCETRNLYFLPHFLFGNLSFNLKVGDSVSVWYTSSVVCMFPFLL